MKKLILVVLVIITVSMSGCATHREIIIAPTEMPSWVAKDTGDGYYILTPHRADITVLVKHKGDEELEREIGLMKGCMLLQSKLHKPLKGCEIFADWRDPRTQDLNLRIRTHIEITPVKKKGK